MAKKIEEQDEIENDEEELASDEEVEVDVTEVNLNEGEINDWIEKLEELKENKEEVTIELDDENELLIKFEKDEEEE